MPKYLINSNCTLFADDTTVYTEINLTGQKFTEDLIVTKSWFLEIGLTVNIKKCRILNFVKKMCFDKHVCVGKSKIWVLVRIDSKLIFIEHISTIFEKLARFLRTIYKVWLYLSKSQLLILHTS